MSFVAYPRFRAMDRAFRNTSGPMTPDPKFKKNPSVERRNGATHFIKIPSACRADGGEIRRRMLMNDIGTQRDVICCRHTVLICGVKNTIFFVLEAIRIFVDISRQALAIPQTACRTLAQGLVHPCPPFLPTCRKNRLRSP